VSFSIYQLYISQKKYFPQNLKKKLIKKKKKFKKVLHKFIYINFKMSQSQSKSPLK
jgi:hypothetical protein